MLSQVVRQISIHPIGFVRTAATEEELHRNRSEIISEVVLRRGLQRALDGIEEYSHIFMLFWMHLVSQTERRKLKTHPRHRLDVPEVGIFSVRERSRPNPIGLAVVELLERRENVLKVRGLDALDGTPVLDIKPYDYIDIKKNIRVPSWWLKAHRRLGSR